MMKFGKIGAIILFCFSLVLMTGCNQQESSSQEETGTTESSESAASTVESETNPKEESESETEDRNIVNSIEVNISNASGEISHEKYAALSDINLQRPDLLKSDEIFVGWEEQDVIEGIGDKSINVEESITMTAESLDISEKNNVIYNNAVYVGSDIPTEISVPLLVGGKTEFCVMDLEVAFDTAFLEFVEFTNVDADVTCNYDKAGNRIYISFVSTENVEGELYLCDVKFRTVGAQKAETALQYDVKDIAAWDAEKSDFYAVKYQTVKGKIVMY
ncbi:MAG: hypothetical protein E7504_04460 [Ruminococcus sp.]|nr:hypothetical protein [Ruminococcus sp.]